MDDLEGIRQVSRNTQVNKIESRRKVTTNTPIATNERIESVVLSPERSQRSDGFT